MKVLFIITELNMEKYMRSYKFQDEESRMYPKYRLYVSSNPSLELRCYSFLNETDEFRKNDHYKIYENKDSDNSVVAVYESLVKCFWGNFTDKEFERFMRRINCKNYLHILANSRQDSQFVYCYISDKNDKELFRNVKLLLDIHSRS